MNRRQFLKWSVKVVAVAVVPLQLVRAAPRPTAFGVDVCPYCSMTVVDLRFAGQVVTPTGLVHSYDAIECLADHLAGRGPTPPTVAEAYLADRAASSREEVSYLPAEEAVVLYHPRLRTPMGGGLAAFVTAEAATEFAAANRLSDARILTWEAVLQEATQRQWVPDY